MTAEVEVPSGPSKGVVEGVEKVGGECNGVGHHRQEEEGLVNNGNENGNGKREDIGSYVLVTGGDGVGGSADDQVEADLSMKNVVGSVENGSVNVDGELKVENGVNGDCSLEGDRDGVALEQEEPGQGSVAESCATEEQHGAVVLEEWAQGSSVDDESEGLLVDAAVVDSSVARMQEGAVVSEDQVLGSSVDAESEGLLVDAAVVDSSVARMEEVTVVSENQVEGSIADAESEELLVDAAVTDSCVDREQNGAVVPQEQTQGSTVAAESEGLPIPNDAAAVDGSVARDPDGAVASEDQVQGSVADAESEGLLVDASVTDSSAAREQNGTVVSEDQVQGSVADAESEGTLVDAAVTDSSAAREQNRTAVSEDQMQGSVDAESEVVPLDFALTNSSEAREQNGTAVSEDQVRVSVADAESEVVPLDSAVTNGSEAREQNGTAVSEDQVQGSVADAESEGLLVDAAVTDSTLASEQSKTVVSEDLVQGSIANAEPEELLVDAAVTDSTVAREQNGTVVSDHSLLEKSSAAAESEGLLAAAAAARNSVAGEQNETVDSEDREQVSIDASAEPEGCLVDAGVENGLGSNGQVEESKSRAVAVMESDPAGGVGSEVTSVEEQIEVESCEDARDIQETKGLAFDVTHCGCGDCEAPLPDAGKSGNGEESNLDLTGQVQEGNAIVSKELPVENVVCDGNENHLNPTKQIEQSRESEIAVQIPIEYDQEQNSKAVSSGDVQTGAVNGGLDYDHPKMECVNVPVAELVNATPDGANPEAHVPCDDHSNMPEEASESSQENMSGQPADANNVLVEANTVDVDTRNVDNIEQLDKIETSNLVEDADGEAQLVENTSELVEAKSADVDTRNVDNIEQLAKIETSNLVEDADGEAQPVENTSELVEEESKDRVVEGAEADINEEGEAQLVEATSDLIRESLKGSQNGVAQVTKAETIKRAVEAGEGGAKSGVKPDLEDGNVQNAEANPKLGTSESIELSDALNGSAEAEASVDELKVEAAETEIEVEEMGQPADADSESLCSPSGPPVEKKPFYYMIRIPRFDDEKLREEIALSQLKVAEKTKIRDAIMAEVQPERIICRDLRKTFQDFVSEQKKLRDLLKSKRQEIDSQQFLISKVRDIMSMDDIGERIRSMKHMIEHESLPLKEEKQYVREIEKLKQTREDISSNMGKQEEVQQTLEQKDQVEKQMKLLRKEVDLLREKLNKVQQLTTAARKKLDDQNDKLQPFEVAYRNADQSRQQEYSHLQSLWESLNEKNKYFRKYRDDVKVAYDYASANKEALHQHCVNQVESFMELWNKNDEFRKEYVKCNLRSTLRRLRTHDGRSLGPDEEPPLIPNAVNKFNNKTPAVVSTPEEERVKEAAAPPVESEIVMKKQIVDVPKNKVIVVKKQIEDVPNNKVVGGNQTVERKPDPTVNNSTSLSDRNKVVEKASEEVTKVVEDEMARKAEEQRKQEEALRLEEQHRLEQKAKAKEALERKKRMAEKAQARAEFRIKKEQEKREKKMEKKKAAAANETNDAEQSSKETPAVTAKEPEHQEKPTTVTKRSSKPRRFTKSKPIPPLPLRNRGKRKMQSWMWFLLSALVVFALFLLGSSDFLSKLGLHKFVH